MKRLALIGCLVVPFMASAADIPQSSARDNRIQYVDYHPGDVVVIHAKVGYISRIVFGKDETIIHNGVASGFSDGWELTPMGNALFVKPRSVSVDSDSPSIMPSPEMWNTNVLVTTNKRLYDFEVRLLKADYAGTDHRAFYRVEFNYPIEETAVKRAEYEKAVEQEQKAIKQAERKAVLPVPQNIAYRYSEGAMSGNIVPTMAYDDGRFTYLRFPNNRDWPTVFIVGADGIEGKVNTHIDPQFPDIMVIHRVSKEMVLRLGRSVVGIHNMDYDVDGTPAINGTTVTSLQRVIRGQ